MLFSSTTFIYLFLPIVLFFNFIVFKKSRLLQNVFLLFASLFFYAWGEPKFVLVMIASIVVNWFIGLIISKKRDSKRISKLIIAFDVAFNLGLLFVFKYLTFAGGILKDVLGLDLHIPNIALPIGISFFTFQAMSYVIDVYRQKGEVQTNILYVGLYISFFPQLIAGPIVRYETIADEIKNRKETIDDFFNGFARFVVGLSKKVLLANSFAILADQTFDTAGNGESISVMFSWLGAVAYTLQIFFDFSGYSDMAIGLGRMFGFHFLENFDYPYISTSITEFWRRWHMSLGQWFRDYVYIPLGGSREGTGKTIRNLFVVWLLTGIWHGANYTFIFWGLSYFVLLILEKYVIRPGIRGAAVRFVWRVFTLLCVNFLWVLFNAPSMNYAMNYLLSMAGWFRTPAGFAAPSVLRVLREFGIYYLLGLLFAAPVLRKFEQKLETSATGRAVLTYVSPVLYILMFLWAVSFLILGAHNPFIYFNF